MKRQNIPKIKGTRIKKTISWPPNYTEIFYNRQERLIELNQNYQLQQGAKLYYKDRPINFIEDWLITYDPRNASQNLPTTMPFILFKRQKEFVTFIYECLKDEQSGLIEKSRDLGATWLCVAISIHLYLFYPGASVGWGSRKESLIHKIGDPDSIFEKIKKEIEFLPKFFIPKGFTEREHSSFMKLINPENGATITGEAGDNIGRGGRKLIYFKDESAHYERPEKIEAALGDNTRVQIDISSVNGTGNVFARKRQNGEEWEPGKKIERGKTRVFIFDWRDHPLKTQKWYEERRNRYEDDGLLHIFAQEVDRDYSAAVERLLIPAIWVKAAINFHLRVGKVAFQGSKIAGLDLADEGGDKNAYVLREGIVVTYTKEWAQGDVGQTTQEAISISRLKGVDELQYDCIGIGATAKSETRRLEREEFNFGKLKIIPWNAAAAVKNPEENVIKGDKTSPKNKDIFKNFKAQAWWNLRTRFEKTFKFVTQGKIYSIDELISIDSKIENFHKLIQQISQPVYNRNGAGKIIVDKRPEGVKSPDIADSLNQAYFPADSGLKIAGTWGGKKK